MSAHKSLAKAQSLHLEQQATIPLRPDGGLRLAVIADTHSRPHPNSPRLVKALRPDAILHAGDIGELAVLDRFRKIAPVFPVRGNIDVRGADLPDVLDLHVARVASRDSTRGQQGEPVLRILLLHIGVNGPRLRADAARLARQKAAQVIVCGHSHVPFIGRDRGLVIFNPGSIGPRRFTLPIVFGVLEIKVDGLHLWHVDSETGEQWMPP